MKSISALYLLKLPHCTLVSTVTDNQQQITDSNLQYLISRLVSHNCIYLWWTGIKIRTR